MATRLTLEFDEKDFLVFKKFRQMFPDLRAMTLGYVGKVGKRKLKQEFLSGNPINLKGSDENATDVMGRKMISSSIGKKAAYVRIASYVLNLFEKGYKLRSGRKVAGKYIMTRKFKQSMMSGLQGIVNEADSKYLQKALDKI
jgi:hypothetical protein